MVSGDVAFTSTLDPRSRRKHERAKQCHPHCKDWCEVHLYEEEDCKRLAKERLHMLAVRATLAQLPHAAEPSPDVLNALLGVLQLVLPSHADVASLAPALVVALRGAAPGSPASTASSGSVTPPPYPSLSFSIPPLPPLSHTPAPPAGARSILTRNAGKRKRPLQMARSHGTTYMSSDDFLSYFQRSRSLSEAVKWIVRDYPSYREVSIYARARRLECKFDAKGRFYQPHSKRGGGGGGGGRKRRSSDEEDSDNDDRSGKEEDEKDTSEAEEKEEDDSVLEDEAEAEALQHSDSSSSSSRSSASAASGSVTPVFSNSAAASAPAKANDNDALAMLAAATLITSPAVPIKVEVIAATPRQPQLLPVFSSSVSSTASAEDVKTAAPSLSPLLGPLSGLSMRSPVAKPTPAPSSAATHVQVLRPTPSSPAPLARPAVSSHFLNVQQPSQLSGGVGRHLVLHPSAQYYQQQQQQQYVFANNAMAYQPTHSAPSRAAAQPMQPLFAHHSPYYSLYATAPGHAPHDVPILLSHPA